MRGVQNLPPPPLPGVVQFCTASATYLLDQQIPITMLHANGPYHLFTQGRNSSVIATFISPGTCQHLLLLLTRWPRRRDASQSRALAAGGDYPSLSIGDVG